jgi:benzoyl-CoA-dihydrodiol lyase
MADECEERPAEGISLPTVEYTESDGTLTYEHVTCVLDESGRVAELTITAPDSCPSTAEEALAQGGAWWILAAFRELDDALLHLRMDLRNVNLVLLRARGSADTVRTTDALLSASDQGASDQGASNDGESDDGESDHWFVNEVRQLVKRTLKRMDLTAKSFYAVVETRTCFVGTFLELALAADRTYVLNDPEAAVSLGVTGVNAGLYPMSNGISRLETRFWGAPERVAEVLAAGGEFDAGTADELGLATFAPDEIDWEDELRIAIEERASFSPDALTGMESNLRFAGPETLETKIFGRLSAWQNWIFQRPNAVGERGALTCYGTPQRPEFKTERT